MKHHSYDELAHSAELSKAGMSTPPLSHEERLTRWIELLRKSPNRMLRTLDQTENWPARLRRTMREDNSAITVAFEDSVLRADGLEGDTYGDAKRYFGLPDWQLHSVVCYCHHGISVPAGIAARQLESYLPKPKGVGLIRRTLQVLRLAA